MTKQPVQERIDRKTNQHMTSPRAAKHGKGQQDKFYAQMAARFEKGSR